MKRSARTTTVVSSAMLVVWLICALAINAGETPKNVRIIYTNDTLGYLEPCGCGGKHDGGLARRATVISQLVKENPNDLIVESGNLSNRADRLDLVASVLAGLHYDAVGVGQTDLSIANDGFFTTMADNKLAVVDASAIPRESTVPYLIKNVGGVRVGVVSFGANPAGIGGNDLERRKALFAAYKAARDGSDVLVVLDQANTVNREWLERNGPRFGVPDVVVGGAMRAYQAEEVVGRTHIVATSMQGKHVGVVDIEITRGQEPSIESKRVAVAGAVVEDQAVKDRIKDFMAKGPKAAPQAAQPAAVRTGNGQPYYPPALCKTCHVKEYEDWRMTRHAVAIKTLTAQNRAIPECLKCHSEQFRRQNRMASSSDGIGGVECATCHMGSLPHGMERKNVVARAKVSLTMCVECHNKERSPDYDEAPYLAKVSHLGVTDPVATAAPPVAHPAMR